VQLTSKLPRGNAVLGNHDYLGDTLVQIGDALTLKDSRWFCQRSFQLKHSLCAPSQKGNNPGSRCDVVEERFSLEQSRHHSGKEV
jgi:hypothetical protein